MSLKTIKINEGKVIDFLNECSDGTLVPELIKNADCHVRGIEVHLDVLLEESVKQILEITITLESEPTL